MGRSGNPAKRASATKPPATRPCWYCSQQTPAYSTVPRPKNTRLSRFAHSIEREEFPPVCHEAKMTKTGAYRER